MKTRRTSRTGSGGLPPKTHEASPDAGALEVSRRGLLQTTGLLAAPVVGGAPMAMAGPIETIVPLVVNGAPHALTIDTRTTLLDLLREHLRISGVKKGCDHGQCGACTILISGERANACLCLAVLHRGDHITTVEGLSSGDQLAPLQTAFIERDGLQCGYCTPGQICSAAGMLKEAQAGLPSHVTSDLTAKVTLTHEEISERLSGNLCRCSAYPNIVAAVADVAKAEGLA